MTEATEQATRAQNPYLSAPVGTVFIRTATPIITVMLINGFYTVVDAVFIGSFVGARALSAVTLMFPIFMMVVALSTLIGTGMASVLARQLGALREREAEDTLMAAIVLAVLVGLLITLLFMLFGSAAVRTAANGDSEIAGMAYDYIALLALAAPVPMLLTVNSDAMRSEGHVQAMALIAVGATVLNIAFNFILIALLDMGVFGSALGTLMAQLAALALVVFLRLGRHLTLALRFHLPAPFWKPWPEILLLGLPPAMNFLGVGISAAVVFLSLQIVDVTNYSATTAAYGIITRIYAFCFLPLLGFSQAMQALVGNNVGAGLLARSDAAILLAIRVAFFYALAIQVLLISVPGFWASLFVDDAAVIAEVARIVPITIAGFSLFAPVMMLGGYFQALGDAPRAALLTLTRMYVFTIPATLTLPHLLGDLGIWIAQPLGDSVMLMLGALLLLSTRRQHGWRLGFLQSS